IAAICAGAVRARGHRRTECGAALADHGAGAAAHAARGGPACARAHLWPHPSGDDGIVGTPRAGPPDGARAGLFRRLQRYRQLERLDPVRPDLCEPWAERLLRNGRDGSIRRDPDVAGAASTIAFSSEVE